MPVLQELNHREISQVISSAADRCVPVTVTVRAEQQWMNLHSRVAGARNQCLLVEMPMTDKGIAHEFAAGEDVGLSLKLKHHKYLFLSSVVDRLPSDGGVDGPLLALGRPIRMQRLQRRAYVRAEVPDGSIVRGAFWLGGRACEPAGTSPDRPVWQGRVVNLSAGGFSLRTGDESIRVLESGYVVGVRMRFGVGREAFFADAMVRHITVEEGKFVVGFQFLGLEHTDEGKDVLMAISRKVGEYQAYAARLEERRDHDSSEEHEHPPVHAATGARA